MSQPVGPIPEGFSTVNPYIAVPDALKLIDFLKIGLGAEEIYSHLKPGGEVAHAAFRIGSSTLMLGELPPGRTPMLAMFYVYVADVDASYQRGIQAGAKSVMKPADQFYGERNAAFNDPAGNQWWIATRKEILSPAELEARMKNAQCQPQKT